MYINVTLNLVFPNKKTFIQAAKHHKFLGNKHVYFKISIVQGTNQEIVHTFDIKLRSINVFYIR